MCDFQQIRQERRYMLVRGAGPRRRALYALTSSYRGAAKSRGRDLPRHPLPFAARAKCLAAPAESTRPNTYTPRSSRKHTVRACLRRPRSCRTAKIRWESRPFNAHLTLKVVISSHFALRCTTFLTLFVNAGICSDESRDSPSISLSSHDFRSKRS